MTRLVFALVALRVVFTSVIIRKPYIVVVDVGCRFRESLTSTPPLGGATTPQINHRICRNGLIGQNGHWSERGSATFPEYTIRYCLALHSKFI